MLWRSILKVWQKARFAVMTRKFPIEHEKRIADRIHDPLGERVLIIDVDEGLPFWTRPGGPREDGAHDRSTVPCLTLTTIQLLPRDERSATNFARSPVPPPRGNKRDNLLQENGLFANESYC
jgi:hypothetical protein